MWDGHLDTAWYFLKEEKEKKKDIPFTTRQGRNFLQPKPFLGLNPYVISKH